MKKSSLKFYIKDKLKSMEDVEYRNFHSKLCPGINNIIGIRVPVLRKFAKELLGEFSFLELYESIDDEYYEEIMLKGMLIGLNNNFNEVKKCIREFVPFINNWAICDTFCAGLKIVKKNKKEMRDFIFEYLNSNNEYELRFMIVMILDYYVEAEYLEENFKVFEQINSCDYYVEMALAWALSICLIKYYDETFEYLKNAKLSDFVYNKTISKACDSYRISVNNKEMLRNLRRNS